MYICTCSTHSPSRTVGGIPCTTWKTLGLFQTHPNSLLGHPSAWLFYVVGCDPDQSTCRIVLSKADRSSCWTSAISVGCRWTRDATPMYCVLEHVRIHPQMVGPTDVDSLGWRVPCEISWLASGSSSTCYSTYWWQWTELPGSTRVSKYPPPQPPVSQANPISRNCWEWIVSIVAWAFEKNTNYREIQVSFLY